MEAVANWNLIPWEGASKSDTLAGKGTRTEQGERADMLVALAPEVAESNTLTDEELMQEVARGNTGALEALYDRYVSGCFGLAMKIVRDPSVAEEVVQEVFVKLWSRPSVFTPHAAGSPPGC